MIIYTKGDLLEAQTEALVNTVNTVGVMGKGIALQFKIKYPENFFYYKNACDSKNFNIGDLLIYKTHLEFPKYIINFPTKIDWKQPSKYEYIIKGLNILSEKIKELNIKSIAIPPLGAGNGKLEWLKVKALIEKHLSDIKNVNIYLYEPAEVYAERDNVKNLQTKISLTPARAMLLQLFYEYEKTDASLNLLVAQKTAYFLQRLGEPLRLKYSKGWYGPYAHNLNKVLQLLNGQFINYPAQFNQPSTEIKIVTTKLPEIENAMSELNESRKKTMQIYRDFVTGFQTPFSLELLATVDWIILNKPGIELSELSLEIKNWTNRKAELIKKNHIEVAFDHLQNHKHLLY